jgi:hypothetical protein
VFEKIVELPAAFANDGSIISLVREDGQVFHAAVASACSAGWSGLTAVFRVPAQSTKLPDQNSA